jgi:hypothetical protein
MYSHQSKISGLKMDEWDKAALASISQISSVLLLDFHYGM